MRVPRFYCESIDGPVVLLGGDQAHHLTGVMRVKAGSEVEVFDGKGTVARASIIEVGRKIVSLNVERVEKFSPLAARRVIIAAAVAKVHRFEQLVTQCSELGVDHIAAVIFERTVKLAAGAAVGQRYHKLAVAACKQSGRVFLPEMAAPDGLEKTLGNMKGRYPEAKIIFGSFAKDARPASEIAGAESDIIAFVGPEGGITEQEEKLLRDNNATGVRLTNTVLRIETAAMALAAILCAARDKL